MNLKSTKFKVILQVVILISAAGLIFNFGYALGQGDLKSGPSKFSIDSLFTRGDIDFDLVEDVWNIINSEYAGDFDEKNLIIGAVRGMLDELDDPHTVFFDEEETEEFMMSIRGSFEGVGIEIRQEDDFIVVVSPISNTPADNAGIQARDIIVEIDGESTEGMSTDEAASRIRGPKGEVVVLTIERNGERVEFSIERDEIEVPSVEWELLEDNIAHIRLMNFTEGTSDDFAETVQEILESDANSIILDVRNNPGGFLDVAIDISSWFFEDDTLVVKEEVGDSTRREHRTNSRNGALRDMPIVVLQNEGSASASEIISGALRDQRSVPVVGETSFGKGSVQSFKELAGGTSLKFTVSRWITPAGHSIEDDGIEPTEKVEVDTDNFEEILEAQKQRAIEVIKQER